MILKLKTGCGLYVRPQMICAIAYDECEEGFVEAWVTFIGAPESANVVLTAESFARLKEFLALDALVK